MALFDLSGDPIKDKREGTHWIYYKKFKDSTLYDKFKEKIGEILDVEPIDSSLEGMKIIENLKVNDPESFGEYKNKDVGGLFGMTLWDFPANHNENWQFTKIKKSEDANPSTKYWRMQLKD